VGDEAKGKIVDLYTEKPIIVARFQVEITPVTLWLSKAEDHSASNSFWNFT